MPELRHPTDNPEDRPAVPAPTPDTTPAGRLDRLAALKRADQPLPTDEPPPLEDRIDAALADHPEVASVLKRLVADDAHPLNVTQALADPARSDATLATIAELADGRLLRDRSLADYLADHPGTGPLFAPVAREVNETADGADRKTAYVDHCKTLDPARTVGPDATDTQYEAVANYAGRLRNAVQPAVVAEVTALAERFDGAEVNVRTKFAAGIVDKVERMTTGSDTRPARPDYRVGDVIDAVGARITVENTQDLGKLVETVQERFGTGDDGRILEIENMYAAPKGGNPSYRVIPMIVSIEVDDVPYTYELQLTTRRASIAADLEHNTVYKPYIDVTNEERGAVHRMFDEAAALDQAETREGSDQ